MKKRQLLVTLNKTLNQVENSRQAIIKNNENLTLEDQRVLFKINGHLKRIHKELYDYNIEQIKS